jgi:hypothetical protein
MDRPPLIHAAVSAETREWTPDVILREAPRRIFLSRSSPAPTEESL